MASPRVSFYKIIIAGRIVEAFQYAKPVGYALLSSKKQQPYRKRREIEKQELTKSSLSRTRNRLMRLINANVFQHGKHSPQFITYTFKENIKDPTTANDIFTNYIKRLNYQTFNTKRSKLKYVSVIEFQKRGAVHYHVVFFNLPKINQRQEYLGGNFAELWSEGYVKIKNINHVPNIGVYMTKYLTKQGCDRRLIGRKKYFSSRGLIKPTVITYDHIAGEMMDYLAGMTSLRAYITKPSKENNYHQENPTFCATYNLTPEQLQELEEFYKTKI